MTNHDLSLLNNLKIAITFKTLFHREAWLAFPEIAEHLFSWVFTNGKISPGNIILGNHSLFTNF